MSNDTKYLAEAILGYRRLQEYNGLYTAYLLGQVSESEFQKDSAAFATPLRDISSEELAEKISCLMRYTDDSYLPSDLACVFQCPESQMNEVISLLAYRRLMNDLVSEVNE